jgi:uncharacterized protein YndB with AHSA1/START domain
VYSQTAHHVVRAPREVVFAALLDPAAIETWRVPDNMTARVEELDARVGGRFRVTLTYLDDGVGKSGAGHDTYGGRFAEIVDGERVVEVIEFESPYPDLAGEMTMTTTLRDVPGGTEVELRHDGVPDAVAPADNRTGTRMALAKLAAYVERRAAG